MRNLLIIFTTILIATAGCGDDDKGKFVKVSAVYKQYACGDWNDDMQILTYNDNSNGFLSQRIIDPVFINGEEELSELFFQNKTRSYGMAYSLEGFIDTSMLHGCDNKAAKFWITHIEKLNGEPFQKLK